MHALKVCQEWFLRNPFVPLDHHVHGPHVGTAVLHEPEVAPLGAVDDRSDKLRFSSIVESLALLQSGFSLSALLSDRFGTAQSQLSDSSVASFSRT